MYQIVEPLLRRIVADHLGVSTDELAPEVSLVDDLAADSLDLVELAIAIEAEFGIDVPEALVDDLRTYADLVDATVKLTLERHRHGRRHAEVATLVRTRVVRPACERSSLERAGPLTPYAAEEIAQDALRAGRGARLEVTVPVTTTDATLARLQEQFAWLSSRGIGVNVSRDHRSETRNRHPSAA
jgi:acyl carrier protein